MTVLPQVGALNKPALGVPQCRAVWRSGSSQLPRQTQIAASAPALFRADSTDQTLATQAARLSVINSSIDASQQTSGLISNGQSLFGGSESEDLSRLHSNGYASTSGTEAVIDSNPNEVFLAELKACDQLEDVMEMAVEESVSMDGAWISASLLRCVSIVKAHRGKGPDRLQGVENGQALAVLLQLIQREASQMTATDLVMCLWSLATMKTKVLRVLKTLQREIDAKVSDLNEREMALTIWSFATLNYFPGMLTTKITDQASSRISKFQPQGLSMMMWAFGKLEQAPSAEFLGGVVSHMYAKMTVFSPQSIANIVHAAGKLKYQISLPICQKVETAVLQNVRGFKDVELANVLFGLVKARYRSTGVTAALEQRVLADKVSPSVMGLVFGTLCWAAGVMAMQLNAETIQALEDQGLGKMKDYNAISACNIAWGLSRQGKVHDPVFGRVLQSIVDFHTQKPLEPRLMRQLFQAVTSARLQGAAVSIPEELEQTAHKWWRKTSLSNTMSMSHAAVAKAVRTLGLTCQSQLTPSYGMPMVDIAIERANEKPLAVMVLNPQEFTLNGTEPMGRIVSSKRLLEAADWDVALLNVAEIRDLDHEPKMLTLVGQLLEQHGIPTSWRECAKQAEKPIPAAIRNHKSRATIDMPVPSESRKLARFERVYDSDEEEEDSDMDDSETDEVTPTRRQLNGASATRDPAKAMNGNAQGVSLRMNEGSKLAALIDQKALKQESPEEQREREQKAAERKRYIATQMSGDFMDGWESLAGWTAMKKVQPARRR